MKIAVLVSRLLLGLAFTVFGLNFFLHFLHMPPPTDPGALGFMMNAGPLLLFAHAVELVGGLMLLANFYAPLALVFLAPVLLNILAYHLALDPAGIAPGVVLSALAIFLGYAYFDHYRLLFEAKGRVRA